MAANMLPMVALLGTAFLLSRKDAEEADDKPVDKPADKPAQDPGVLLRDIDCVFDGGMGEGKDGPLIEGVANMMIAVQEQKSPIVIAVWGQEFYDKIMSSRLMLTSDVCAGAEVLVFSYEALYRGSYEEKISDAEALAETISLMLDNPNVEIGRLRTAARVMLENFKQDLDEAVELLSQSEGYVIAATDYDSGATMLSVGGPEIMLTSSITNKYKIYDDMMDLMGQYIPRGLRTPPLFSFFDPTATVAEFESDLNRTFKFISQQQDSLAVLGRLDQAWEEIV